MKYVTLGSTGITVNKNGFGALPIQRISFDEAAAILRRAYEGGIRYFDTARFYTDSEEKIAYALSDVRSEIFIASKSMAKDAETFKKELEISLKNLNTDYIDVHQFHNLPFVPVPGHESGLYEVMLEAKAEGKIRHIGFTNHRIKLAFEAVESGLYETIQFPFSYLASDEEKQLVALCKEKNIGFICMKGLAGGLIRSGRAAFAGLADFDNALPIWGIQKMEELEEFLSCNTEDFEQGMTPEIEAIIEADKKELVGGFCRSCGYCQSACPQGIEISNCARMTLMLRRAPVQQYTTDEWKDKMRKAATCIECGACKQRCPYGLDIPRLLKENVADYQKYI